MFQTHSQVLAHAHLCTHAQWGEQLDWMRLGPQWSIEEQDWAFVLGVDRPRDLGAGPGRGLNRYPGTVERQRATLAWVPTAVLSLLPVKPAPIGSVSSCSFSEGRWENAEGHNMVPGTKF